MTMGSAPSKKTEPDFTDDCFLFIPQYEDERKTFNSTLFKRKQLNRPEEIDVFQKHTRTLETIMFMCWYSLSQRSFDYNVMVKELKIENLIINEKRTVGTETADMDKNDEPVTEKLEEKNELEGYIEVKKNQNLEVDDKQKIWYGNLLATIIRNFKVMAKSEMFPEIRKTKDGDDDCYSLIYRKWRPFGKPGDINEIKNTKSAGTDNSYQSVTIREETLNPDEQNDKVTENSQEGKSEEAESSDGNYDKSQKVKVDETKISKNKKPEEPTKKELENFEKLFKSDVDEEIKETDRKINDLNKNIVEKNLKMEEDRKIGDMKSEAEFQAFEEKIKKEKEEFLEAEKQKQQIHEEKMKERRRKREEYEQETENIRIKQMEDLNYFVAGFLKCVEFKLKWEMKEDEWSVWLRTLRSLVARAKIQFLNLESSIQTYGIGDKESRFFVEEDFEKLHEEVLFTHTALYNAFFFIKDLSSLHSDHTFLYIIQKQLSKICSLLLSTLHGIDETKIEETSLKNLRNLFNTFDSSDIFYTSELRKLDGKEDPEKYKDIEDPEKYEPKNDVKIEEVVDPEKSENLEETSSVGKEGNEAENQEESGGVVEKSEALTESETGTDETQPQDPKNDEKEEENKNEREGGEE